MSIILWQDNPQALTTAIQTAMDAASLSGDELHFEADKVYPLVTTLRYGSRTHLFGHGATLLLQSASGGAFVNSNLTPKGDRDTDVLIDGLIINGNSHQRAVDTKTGHLVTAMGVNDLTLRGCTFLNSPEDGVYIGGQAFNGQRVNTPCRNVWIENSHFDHFVRNAITLTSVDGVVIANSTFDNANEGILAATIDCEINQVTDLMHHITIRDNVIHAPNFNAITLAIHPDDNVIAPDGVYTDAIAELVSDVFLVGNTITTVKIGVNNTKSCARVWIVGNNIQSNNSDGINMKVIGDFHEQRDVIIIDNDSSAVNGAALHLRRNVRLNVCGNHLHNSQWGMRVNDLADGEYSANVFDANQIDKAIPAALSTVFRSLD